LNDSTIALVGMPGGGKSTVGRQLARHCGRRFFDSDKEIENRTGSAIRSIFEKRGEAFFRDIEQEVIRDLLAQGNAIIATGGGAILRESNRQLLRDNATVVYLRSRPEDLFRRLRHDTRRPLLQVRDPLQTLRDLFAARDPLYQEASHFVIETGRPSISGLVSSVLMQLEVAGVVDPMRSFQSFE
jgi:shikimate kinase